MPLTIASASAARPWVMSQRGLSGIHSRIRRIASPSAAPMKKAIRQPVSGSEMHRIEQDHRAGGANRRADPEAAVDDEVGPAAHARRDQLLDRRVDRRVLAADAGAGEETEETVAPEVPGQGGRGGRDEIERERDEEELLAPEPVGQPAEEQRAQDRAEEIGRGGEADVGIRELQRRAFLQGAGERAGERDLEPIEDPGDAERDDDEVVEPPPGQPVEPSRNVGLDDAGSDGLGDRLGEGRCDAHRETTAAGVEGFKTSAAVAELGVEAHAAVDEEGRAGHVVALDRRRARPRPWRCRPARRRGHTG